MKLANTNTATYINQSRTLILIGALAAMAASVACSNNAKPIAKEWQPEGARVQQATLNNVAQTTSQRIPMKVASDSAAPAKAPQAKSITYKSRDYGVSFVYPWQYSFITAKRIANDVELQPKFDGDDGQFTLARIDIPKGFYPDTDFESGYFTLSLNQDISEEQCSSALGTGNDGDVKKETINGVDFQWVETEVSGGGSAAKLRDYVTFVNGSCYELELGVMSKNNQGLVREVSHDQVLRRLDGILQTVNILPEAGRPMAQHVSSLEEPTLNPQK